MSGEILRIKKALLRVLVVFLNQILLGFLPRSNFLFDGSRNLKCSKDCTLVEADKDPLETAKIELFVTIVYAQSHILQYCHK